jgi:tetratricopeptide (TPR) repeat protein
VSRLNVIRRQNRQQAPEEERKSRDPEPGRPGRRVAVTLVVACFLIALGGALVVRAVQQFQSALEQARQEIGRRRWAAANQRLRALGPLGRLWGGDEVAYLVGVCEWKAGNRQAALKAFRSIPLGSRFDCPAAAFQAEALVMNWQLRAAEDQLVRVMRPGRPGLSTVRTMLVRLGRMEARFGEVRAWLRAGFAEADDPVDLLRKLWALDRGGAPVQGLRENLEEALRRSPEDDRVWLGLGRVATLEGRFDEASNWLRRCSSRHPDDQAILQAWLDWSRSSGSTSELRRFLASPRGAEFEPVERLADRAWLAQRACATDLEEQALECWLQKAAHNPVALERLGTLAAQAGAYARAEELRRRKARVDEALDRYQRRIESHESFASLADRVAMAQVADEAGRPFDAEAWCTLAERIEPGNPQVATIRQRLNRAANPLPCEAAEGSQQRQDTDPLRLKPSGPPMAHRRAHPNFRDDAGRAGICFRLDNGETAIHQIPELMSGGVGLLDYDGDGWVDVFCVQGGPFPPDGTKTSGGDRLFHNRRDGTFEDVTESAGIARFPRGYGHGVAAGDYDNDGRTDLFVTRWRSYSLYRNRGDGSFEDVTASSGLGGDRDWPTSAALADLDGDGDLDLYVCHYLRWDAEKPTICRDPLTLAYTSCRPLDFPALPDHIFRNDGGHFVDVTAKAGIVDQEGRGLGVVATDLDGDGKVDLFVANDTSANYLFRNLGGLHFEESGQTAGVACNAAGGYQAGMGVACGDFDGDGRPDLAVTNYFGESTSLYRNLGNGLFSDLTAASGLGIASRHLLGFGASFLDADNDGHLDLLTANGHVNQLPGIPYKMPVQFLLGDGQRLADSDSPVPALTTLRMGRGLAVGDLDNDGRLDALVIDQKGPLAYLHNQTSGAGHFVTLLLEGTRSNRDGVGASVMVQAGGRRQYGWRVGGGSYQSASDSRLHFGLGSEERIETVEVTWPSGLTQRCKDLPADHGYLVREGDQQPRLLPGFLKK